MNTLACLVIMFSCLGSIAQTQLPSSDLQLKYALLAAPADRRDSATVYGYNDAQELVLLRKGTNELVCIADDPKQAGFSVACYHRDLQPFMQRGRDLKKQGKSSKEVFEMREKEVKSGTLKMPRTPTTLFVYSAKQEDYDGASGEVKNGYLRSVVYIPFATPQSTGLPLKPAAPGLPWIMDPGTHAAHIMINPPASK